MSKWQTDKYCPRHFCWEGAIRAPPLPPNAISQTVWATGASGCPLDLTKTKTARAGVVGDMCPECSLIVWLEPQCCQLLILEDCLLWHLLHQKNTWAPTPCQALCWITGCGMEETYCPSLGKSHWAREPCCCILLWGLCLGPGPAPSWITKPVLGTELNQAKERATFYVTYTQALAAAQVSMMSSRWAWCLQGECRIHKILGGVKFRAVCM